MGGSVGSAITGGISKGIGAIGGGAIGSGLGTAILGPVGGIAGGFLGAKKGINLGSDTGGGPGPNTSAPQTSPLQILVQSGGAPLLANIAMGAGVETSLAGYFGYSDYNQMLSQLSPEDADAVKGLHQQLTNIQNTTDLRNQAVDKIINDFPNIAQQALQKQKSAYASAASDFDAADKASLDRASDQLAAKYAASGGFSSGAFNAGLARTAADTANIRAQNVYGSDISLANQDYSNQLEAANLRYGEASALQNFQQKMLGQITPLGFSASQNALTRNADIALNNAGYQQKLDINSRNQDSALFGSLGKLAGTVGGYTIGGPLGAAVGNTFGTGGFQMPQRRASTGGGYRDTLMSDNGANV